MSSDPASDAEEESRVWPPPVGLPPVWPGPPPRAPRVTNRFIGRVSLGLSSLGLLGELAYAFSVVEFGGGWDAFWLEVGVIGCFVLGFSGGIVGRSSWEGKAGVSLALLSSLSTALCLAWIVRGIVF